MVKKEKPKINSSLMFFTAILGGIIGLILTYSILTFISIFKKDLSLIDSNKWYFISFIPSEIVLVFVVLTTGSIISAFFVIVILAVIIFVLSAILNQLYGGLDKKNKKV
jgi:hypothetical protein